jgi:transcriptional regulator with XRE-family HTH domain
MNIPHTIAGLQKAGLTQKEIGEAIGRSQSAVSDMAAGKIGSINPSYLIVKRLEALAAERGVTSDPASGTNHVATVIPHKLSGETV